MGDRKARLAALAAKAGRAKKPDEAGPSESDEGIQSEKSLSVSFRNYVPSDKALEAENVPEEEPETKRQKVEEPVSSTSALQDALKEAKQEVLTSNGNEASIPERVAAPKKINSDLKRDIQDKVGRLERQTQKAIVEMLKARLEREATEQAESEAASDLD